VSIKQKLLLGLTGLLIVFSPFIIGKVLLSLSLMSLKSSSQLSVTYESAYTNALTGKVKLQGVTLTRPVPNFVNVEVTKVDIDLDISKTLFGPARFTSLKLEGLEGRVIRNNVSVPFQFSRVLLKDFAPSELVEGALFNSEVSGQVWESSIEVTSQNMTISSLPIDKLNTLFDNPITGFKYGLLSISTLSGWDVEEPKYTTQLRIRLSGLKAEVPDTITGLEKLLASQLVAYVNRQKSLSFEAPTQLNREKFNGNDQHDFNYVFQTIGSSMIDALPSQFSNVKRSQNVSSNPLNLSDKHIQSIQKKLQSLLGE